MFFFLPQGEAQVLPPDLICINSDTLRWELPQNNCGTFNAYVVYGSQDNEAGPYSILATITDPAQTEFIHPTPSNQLWYYYLQSDYDCAGQPVLSSDTLDNLIPEPGPLQFVTVTNDTTVDISWNPSPSPEVFGYIISRNNQSGTTILDTLYNTTTYTDFNAAPGEQPETYFVTALDACGNVSLVPPPHRTMYLTQAGVDPCERTVTLNWNSYEGWENGPESQEVWVSVNGGPYELEATMTNVIPGSGASYVFGGAGDGDTYCFYVIAKEAGTDFTSKSNTICETVDVVEPIADLLLTNATVTDNGIDLNWRWSTEAEIAAATLLHSTDGAGFSPIADLSVAPPLQVSNDLSVPGLAVDAGAQYFRIEAVDACGEVTTSNVVGTVFLSGEVLSGQGNQLEWTPYFNEKATISSYQLVRTTAAGPLTVAVAGPNESNILDPIDLADPDLVSACYYVVAEVQVQLSDGLTSNVNSRSNTICLEQGAQIFVPNAFAPDGSNRIFKPVMQFGFPDVYSLRIFDRYGGLVFESRSFDQGWDGKKDGRPLPQGFYVYLIRLTQGNGVEVEKKGGVMLVR